MQFSNVSLEKSSVYTKQLCSLSSVPDDTSNDKIRKKRNKVEGMRKSKIK